MIQTLTPTDNPKPMVWTIEEYQRLGESGLFNDRRIELVEGCLLEMSPQGSKHASTLMKLVRLLPSIFDDRYSIAIQSPLAVSELSQPEPDAAVLLGEPEAFRDVLPKVALLVIEVSDTTLAFDRTTKSRIYAKAGIVDYWIINVVECCVEVNRQPTSAGEYEHKQILKSGDKVSPLAMLQASINVEVLLP
jgi:Uma2 family endonuclease